MKNYLLCASIFLFSCTATKKSTSPRPAPGRSVTTPSSPYIRSTVLLKKAPPPVIIDTKNTNPLDVVRFARQQIGVPYRFGGIDRKGFDCSGFINYVFGHFKIHVPRTSYMFTSAGVDIPIEFSKPGDLILFTGSDAGSGTVGHMGIVTSNHGGYIEFIHASTSNGVMISTMNSYFIPRYVRTNRIFIPSFVAKR